jgi:hypothetical protein
MPNYIRDALYDSAYNTFPSGGLQFTAGMNASLGLKVGVYLGDCSAFPGVDIYFLPITLQASFMVKLIGPACGIDFFLTFGGQFIISITWFQLGSIKLKTRIGPIVWQYPTSWIPQIQLYWPLRGGVWDFFGCGIWPDAVPDEDPKPTCPRAPDPGDPDGNCADEAGSCTGLGTFAYFTRFGCETNAVDDGLCTEEEVTAGTCAAWVPRASRCFKDICVEQDVLRVSLYWRSEVNLELLVKDPSGNEYSYAQQRGTSSTTESGYKVTMGSCGGTSCGDATNIPVENITFDAPGEGLWEIKVFSPNTLDEPVEYSIEVEDTENNIRHEFTGVIKELNLADQFGENDYEYCRPGVFWNCDEDSLAGQPESP